jgi:pimeloyl-ACP methyl ester carboxylesterase
MPDVFVIGHSVGGAVAAAVGAGAVAHSALLNAAASAAPASGAADVGRSGSSPATAATPALATNLREHLLSQAEERMGAAVPTGAAYCPGPSTAAAHAAAGFVFPIPLPKGALAGISVIDVVEDTAIESVMYMDEFLKRRPSRFPSVGAAAEWFLRQGGMCSPTSARHSVPSLFVRDGGDVADTLVPASPSGEAAPSGVRDMVEHAPEGAVRWVTDLAATRMHWSTWFVGLDRMFLSAPCPRLLLVAKTDRLDKAMTVAHMQGSFQLELVRDAGHYLMEDTPEQAAVVLQRFLGRIEASQAQLCARLEAAAAKGAALLRAVPGASVPA